MILNHCVHGKTVVRLRFEVYLCSPNHFCALLPSLLVYFGVACTCWPPPRPQLTAVLTFVCLSCFFPPPKPFSIHLCSGKLGPVAVWPSAFQRLPTEFSPIYSLCFHTILQCFWMATSFNSYNFGSRWPSSKASRLPTANTIFSSHPSGLRVLTTSPLFCRLGVSASPLVHLLQLPPSLRHLKKKP